MTERPTLIVMAKAPRLGLGKTRLAAAVGRVEAWRVNRALQARALRVACDQRWRTFLCVTPDDAMAIDLPGIWPRGVARMPQGGGDLGRRLARALSPYRRVAVIGTDCPALTRRRVADAFAALRRAPFALGPAGDGGFWLLAARDGAQAAQAMAGVRWSTRFAARDVVANLGAGRVALLARLDDVDTLEDLRRWRQRAATRASSGV